MTRTPDMPRHEPLPLVANPDGSRVSVRTTRDAALLIVERSMGGCSQRVSTPLTTEQAATLVSFAERGSRNSTDLAPSIEIERKWRPSDVASLNSLKLLEERAIKVMRIDQGYLCLGRDEARVRRKGDSYYLTLKGSGGLERHEIEVALSPRQFKELWPATEGQRLEKTRSVFEMEDASGGAVRVEVDRFHAGLESLVLVECEFSSAESAAAFMAPPYFGAEVTEDPGYKNRSLATQGIPPGDLSSISLPPAV